MIKTNLSLLQPETTKLLGIYRGVVEDNKSDPSKAGRVKIRVFGVHSPIKVKTKTEGLPTAELPWAEPALGLFEGSVSGFGTWTIPLQGAHVFVFFEGGNHMQPRYFASAPGIPTEKADIKQGFNDPSGEYPKLERMGEPDFHRLARGKTDETIVTYKDAHLDENVAKADDGEWSEPESAYSAQYPNNTVLVSHSGLTVEVDSTLGSERFHIYHPSNTYIEIDNQGNMVVRNENNKFQIVKGEKNTHIILDENETVEGSKTKLIKNNEIMEVQKNQHETIKENTQKLVEQEEHLTVKKQSRVYLESTSDIYIGRARNIRSEQEINMDAPRINLNSGYAPRNIPKKPKE